MSGLTDQIRHSVNNPLTSTDFDFTAVLDDVLSTVGLSVTDAGGNVRFYGGEPLLHPDLPRMVEHATSVGVQPYVTTNAIILEQKIDALYAAGLRSITVGFYGTEAKYDAYVQRKERFARMEAGIAAVRDR